MILIAVISLGAIGAIGAVFLYAASKKFEVYEDPRIAQLRRLWISRMRWFCYGLCKSRHVGRPVMPRRRSTCNGQSSHHPRKRSSQCRTDGSRCPLQRNVCRPSAYQPIRRCAELCDCFHLVRRRDRLFIRLLRLWRLCGCM